MANMTFGVNIIPKDNTVSLGTSQNKWKINGVDDPKLTDTDTKVTAVGNHYTPAEDTTAKLSADASSSTAATWNSTSLVTGIDIERDAKGHVVGVAVDSIKMPANPNSDTHRAIKVNGTQALGNNTTALNLKAGSNVAITDGGSGAIIIEAANTWRPVSDSVSSTSSSDAASSKAVKTAYDLAASKTANTGTVTSVAAGIGLAGGTITGSGALKAKLRSETALTINSVAATTTSKRVYPVAVDKAGYLAVNVPWTDTDNNTTYSAGTGLSLSGTEFSNSGVIGVKGSSESTYRTGNVNLTPANIGAMAYDAILAPSTSIPIPASGLSASYNMTGLTSGYALVRWHFSQSPENNPPVSLSWATYNGYFTITNNGGTTSESITPVFAHPTIIATTSR